MIYLFNTFKVSYYYVFPDKVSILKLFQKNKNYKFDDDSLFINGKSKYNLNHIKKLNKRISQITLRCKNDQEMLFVIYSL